MMSKELQFLVLEDDPFDADLTIATLEEAGYTCRWERVETRSDFLTSLEQSNYDVVLADYSLPGFDGLSALKLLRERDPDLPFILISGTVGEEVAIASLKAGVTDYILKDRLQRLVPAVRRALRDREEQQQLEQMERLLQTLNAAALAMGQALTPEDIFAVLVKELGILGFSCMLFPTDKNQTVVFPKYQSYEPDLLGRVEELGGFKLEDLSISIETTKMLQDIVWKKQTILLTDSQEFLRQVLPQQAKTFARPIARLLKASRTIGTPLIVENQVIGVLVVQSDNLDQDDIPAVTAFAHQVAAAWYRARLFEQAQQELTERRRTEKALRESEHFLRDVFEAIQNGINVLDRNLIVIRTNRWMEKLYPDRLPLVGKRCYEVYWQRQSPCPNCPSLRTFETGDSQFEVIPYPSAERPVGWVELSAFPLKGADGSIVGVIEYMNDITERRQAEKERIRLATVVEQATEIVIITDTKGIIQYVNPAFEQITGYSRREAIGQNSSMLSRDLQDAAFYHDLWKTIVSGRVWHGRLVNRKKDGTLYTEDATISPVRDENGVVVSYVAVKRDVTNELEMEERYRQAQKMEAIGRLAGGIAHDFNNLLTVIKGYTAFVLCELESSDPRFVDLQEVANAADRASALTSQLLAFSRRQVLQPKLLDINDLIDGAAKMLRRLIGEDIELSITLDPTLGYVLAEPGQIEQVILNLSVNARDAMPKGGELTFETANILLDESYARVHPGVKPGTYIQLTVSDTGTGMTEKVKAHLFEPFFTTKEKNKGTGLGLATVWGIVEQSNGHIEVYSELGIGTTFKICLPHVDKTTKLTKQEQNTGTLPRGTETILLVEDENPVRELASRMLKNQGYTVLTAGHPDQALLLDTQHSEAIHLLVTDVVMPGMGGRELAERLVHSRPELKVLYISGYTDDAILRHGVLEPGIAFLHKPFTPTALANKVREVLDTIAQHHTENTVPS